MSKVEEGLRPWPNMEFSDADDAKSSLDWHESHAKMHADKGKTETHGGRKRDHIDYANVHKRKAKAAQQWLAANATKPVAEGRYPTKQSPKMAALAAEAEKAASEERAKPKKKVMKKKTNESNAVSGLAFLVESELEKAQVTIAAKGILDKLQKMAEDLSKMEADDIMPMLDSMRLTFGPEITDNFNETTTSQIRNTIEAVKTAKEAITAQVGRLEGEVNGEETNDMAGADLGGDMDDGMGGDPMADANADMDAPAVPPQAGGDDLGADNAEMDVPGGDDLDAAFDDAASDATAAGRARKESIERNVKALSESKNPDRLIFETFRRTLTELKDAIRSARAVATAFAIDLSDVITIVKEGKTYKDEKDKTNKNKDRKQDRKDKKRDRPTDLDEGKEDIDAGLEEGKTFKDERDKTNKNKDYSDERKRKNRDREDHDDLEEAALEVFTSREKAKEKSAAERKAKGFGAMAEKDKKKETVKEFEMKPTAPSKKGMFNGKTKAELRKMASEVKAQMKTHEDKGDAVPKALKSKHAEIDFALRAKNDWGKAE